MKHYKTWNFLDPVAAGFLYHLKGFSPQFNTPKVFSLVISRCWQIKLTYNCNEKKHINSIWKHLGSLFVCRHLKCCTSWSIFPLSLLVLLSMRCAAAHGWLCINRIQAQILNGSLLKLNKSGFHPLLLKMCLIPCICKALVLEVSS